MLVTIASTLLLSAVASAAELSFFQGTFDEAVAEAGRGDKLVAVYFWRAHSEHCAALWQRTLQDDVVARALDDSAVMFSANFDDAAGASLFERFSVSTLPTIVFLSSDGAPEDAVQGYIEPGELLVELERIGRGEGTVSGLRRSAAAAKPGSDEAIDLYWRLAGKVHDLGLLDEHKSVLATVREQDPKGRTVVGARAHLWHVRGALWDSVECSCEGECVDGACDGPRHAHEVDAGPLYEHARRMKLPEARFEAWNAVATFERYRLDAESACKAYERAAEDLPEKGAVRWSREIAWWAIERAREGEAGAREKRLALKLAELAVKHARALAPDSDGYADSYGDREPRAVEADALATLAFALGINGRDKQAVELARDVLAREDSEELRELLRPLLERS